MTTATQEIMIARWHPSFTEDVARLCKAFSEESLNEYGLGVEQDRLDQMIEVCKDIAFFLLATDPQTGYPKPVGVIAGFMVANMTNGKPALQEVIWYMDKEHRTHGKLLLEAFEKLGKERGATSIIMALMCNSMQDRLDKFYQRLGYKPFEVQYMKEIT